MKNKSFARLISLVLILVMIVSTMAVSAFSVSAATKDDAFALELVVNYTLDFCTAGTDGESSDEIMIKINGKIGGKDASTEWQSVGKVGKDRTASVSFLGKHFNEIESITVKNNGKDGWYPEYINLKTDINRENSGLTFYGGRWVDDGNEVTLALTDKVLKLNVVTSGDNYSGTDADVIVKLYGENNTSTGNINLSDIHPKFDAFERKDNAIFYFAVPENFGTLKKASFTLKLIAPEGNIFTTGSDWRLGSLDFTFNDDEFSNKKDVNKWLSGESSSDFYGPLDVKF